MAQPPNTPDQQPDPAEQSDRNCGEQPSKGGMGRAILERRYASGKITRQQYESLLKELGWDDARRKK
jgi:hypothetical protein